MARPVWSGPTEKYKFASTTNLRSSATRRGTPSREPRKVSTSTFRPMRVRSSIARQQRRRRRQSVGVGIENRIQRGAHVGGRSPAQFRRGVLDRRQSRGNVRIPLAVVVERGNVDQRGIARGGRVF